MCTGASASVRMYTAKVSNLLLIQEATMSQKIEKIKEEKRRNEVKLRQLKHEQKALEAEGKGLRRRERNHRIFTRGGMLEAFLLKPTLLTDDQVHSLLKIIFHKPEVNAILNRMIAEAEEKIGEVETDEETL